MAYNFYIQTITESRIPELKEISDEEFGLNYIEPIDFHKFLKDSNFIGILAIYKKMAIGFSIIEFCSIDQLVSSVNLEESLLRSRFKMAQPICYRKHTVVKKKYQHLGVGQKLLNKSIQLATKRSKSMISIVWEQDMEFNFGHLLQSSGFEVLIKVSDYWSAESIKKNYFCSKCGRPPCRCSAIVYTRSL